MSKRNYIDFDKEEVPVIFDIDIGEEQFTMGINYNQTNDFFTCDLWDSGGDVIVLGEKMIINRPLFDDLVDERLPGPASVPMDESGKEDRITYENFGVTVFLYIDDVLDDDDPDPDEYGDNDGY